MNRSMDGLVFRLAADTGMCRWRGLFNRRQAACAIAALALVKVFSSAPQACGDDRTPVVFANRAMSLTVAHDDAEVVKRPSPAGSVTANRSTTLDHELEPVSAEEMHLTSWQNVTAEPDLSCELRQLVSMLACVPFNGFELAVDRMRATEGILSDSSGVPAPMTETVVKCDVEQLTVSEDAVREAIDHQRQDEPSPLQSMQDTSPCVEPSPIEDIVACLINPPDAGFAEWIVEAPTEETPEPVAAVIEMKPICDDASKEMVAVEHQGVPLLLQKPEATPACVESTSVVEMVAGFMTPPDCLVYPLTVAPASSEEAKESEAQQQMPSNEVVVMTEVDQPQPEPSTNRTVEETPAGGMAASLAAMIAGITDSPKMEFEAPSVEAQSEVEVQDSDGDDESAVMESDDEADEDQQSQSDDVPLPMKETTKTATTPFNGDIIAGVSILSENAQRITVGRNSSAAIDLKMDCDRAEIADPAIADIFVISPKRVIVSGKAFGTTQMILRVGEQQKVFSISVEHDLRVLANVIRSISPTANVHPQSVNGTIVLTGTVPDSQVGDRIAEMASLFQGGPVRNQLSVAGVQQTLLRVVVAEVNKEAVRQLGFNWAIGGADWTRDFFFANNVGGLNPTVFGSNGSTNIGGHPTPQITYSVLPNANTAATNLTFGFPRAEFQVFMQALRQNSLARVLAEPNLVAISGQTATFLAGGEVPIPVTQGGAVAGSITIEYKEFGVRLAFTPTVLAGQIVRLHVMSEVSDAIPGDTIAGGLPVFSFTTRRVESTVECGNGQTFAMAGLLNEQVQAVARKLPGLGDVPVLGSLFSSVEYQKNNTELVVLVTPQLVEPLDPQQIPPPPGALMTAPNDYELFGLGQLEGVPNEAPSFDRVPRDQAPVNTPPVSTSASAGLTSQYALRGPWGFADMDEN